MSIARSRLRRLVEDLVEGLGVADEVAVDRVTEVVITPDRSCVPV